MNEPNIIPMTEEKTPTPTREQRKDAMTDKINRALNDIQSLTLQPTESNCALICDAILNIKQAWQDCVDAMAEAETLEKRNIEMGEKMVQAAREAEKDAPALTEEDI